MGWMSRKTVSLGSVKSGLSPISAQGIPKELGVARIPESFD
jgi:hypothetical protein